ncbi:MAG: FAD-dependent oxidoreductase, partial [Anaerolineae bacterium]
DMIRKALSRFGLKDKDDMASDVESALADETLHYSRTGSRELPMALADAILADGGRVLTSSPVTAIETSDGRVVRVSYRRNGADTTIDADFCISTIPLPVLPALLRPQAPDDVLRSSRALGFRPLVVYGLLVRRDRVLDAQYIYFRDRVFHRVAEPKNSGLEVTPPDHTVLLVEMTCAIGDDRWNGGEETHRRIARDLAGAGLVDPDEIVETHVVRSEHGYPLFEIGFEPHFERIMEHVGGIDNLWTTGRQGGFCYPNMHGAMRMGADAAEEVLSVGRHDPETDQPWRPAALDESGISLSDGDLAEEG